MTGGGGLLRMGPENKRVRGLCAWHSRCAYAGRNRQVCDLFAERFIRHRGQLSQQQIAVTIPGSVTFSQPESQDAGFFNEPAGRRDHDRGWIVRLIHEVGL